MNSNANSSPPATEPLWLNMTEACAEYGISRWTLSRMRKAKKLKGYRREGLGGQVWFKGEDLDRVIGRPKPIR